MNAITIIGIILIAIGAVGLIYGGITYTSGRDVVDMGPMHLEVDQEQHIPFSPIAGGVAMAAGLILVIVGKSKPVGARLR